MEVLGESTPIGSEQSIVDLLKADLQDVQNVEDVTIAVPGWERTGLAIRYRMPESGKELGRISQKVLRETKDTFDRNLFIAIDTMIALNVGLYVRPAGVEDYVELDPDNQGAPISLSEKDRLVGVFGWNPDEAKTARSVVKKLFGNDLALISHSEKLDRWLRDSKAEVEEGLWESGEV